MMRSVTPSLRSKADSVAVQAIDAARAALLEEADPADVGDHLGHVVEGERLVTHLFACTRRGYAGWHWSVTVARASRQKGVTVDEIVLVPGDEAIVAPEWVPYKERVKPGDLSPGDLLPVEEDDPRLVPTYSFGDDPLDDRRQGAGTPGRPGARPRPGPHALAWRGATSPPSAGTTATAARPRRSPSRRPTSARPAAS